MAPKKAPLPEWTDWASFWLDIAQAVAVLVAGVFAYWKFFKGRTFARRLEPNITGSLVAGGGVEAIRTRFVLKNTGVANVPLENKVIRVFSVDATGCGKMPEWKRLKTVRVLERHSSLESQETLSDEVLIPVRDREVSPVAYRLEFVVQDRERWRKRPRRIDGDWSWKRGIQWSCESVVLRQLRAPDDRSQNQEEASHD